MSDTPSARIVAEAAKTVTITDARGRSMLVRRLGVMDRMKFFRIVPNELQGNQMWLIYALTAASVTEIDGVPCPPYRNADDVERAAEILGEDAIGLVQEAVNGLAGVPQTDKEALAAAGEQPGTPPFASVSGS